MPTAETWKAAPNMYCHKGFKSRNESGLNVVTTKRSLLLTMAVGRLNDLDILVEPRAKGKCCSICRCRGHQRGSCPKINKFRKPPFSMNKDMVSRHELITALSSSGRYNTEYRPPGDVQKVSTTTPPHMLGIVIHRRFFMSPNITQKLCLECTILDQLADAHTTFQNYLFTSECIISYLSSLKSNVVVCELEDLCNEGYKQFVFPMSQTQPNIQYLSQSEQMGYGIVSESNPMSYGLSEPL